MTTFRGPFCPLASLTSGFIFSELFHDILPPGDVGGEEVERVHEQDDPRGHAQRAQRQTCPETYLNLKI